MAAAGGLSALSVDLAAVFADFDEGAKGWLAMQDVQAATLALCGFWPAPEQVLDFYCRTGRSGSEAERGRGAAGDADGSGGGEVDLDGGVPKPPSPPVGPDALADGIGGDANPAAVFPRPHARWAALQPGEYFRVKSPAMLQVWLFDAAKMAEAGLPAAAAAAAAASTTSTTTAGTRTPPPLLGWVAESQSQPGAAGSTTTSTQPVIKPPPSPQVSLEEQQKRLVASAVAAGRASSSLSAAAAAASPPVVAKAGAFAWEEVFDALDVDGDGALDFGDVLAVAAALRGSVGRGGRVGGVQLGRVVRDVGSTGGAGAAAAAVKAAVATDRADAGVSVEQLSAALLEVRAAAGDAWSGGGGGGGGGGAARVHVTRRQFLQFVKRRR